MRIGLAFDLKDDASDPAGRPDDWQEEFDSPETVEAIAQVLRARGHETVLLGNGPPLVDALRAQPPDLVFNLAEGHGIGRSREARVPALCELLGIPHTGSDPLTLAATLDKDIARRLAASAGVAVPHAVLAHPGECPDPARDLPAWPVIVKPAWEGSSKGVRGQCVVHRPEDLPAILEARWQDYRQPLVIEEFIVGDEVTVGVLGNDPPQVLGAMRILPRQPDPTFVYSLEVKRDWRLRVRYESPAVVPESVRAALRDDALRVFRVLGCADVARIDFRVRDGRPVFIEINPLPGLNPETSDLVILARGHGLDYPALIGRILDAAQARMAR